MEDIGLKWTLEEGKDWEAEKAFLPRGTEGGICILWGRDENKETWLNLWEGFWLRNHMENKLREIREPLIMNDQDKQREKKR